MKAFSNGIWGRQRPSFGFVSTRFCGTDGVSLETAKWAAVLGENGCATSFMAGRLDTDPERSHLAPTAFFKHPEIEAVQHELFVEKKRTRALTRRIHRLKEELLDEIEAFHRRFGFDILVVQNALSIPVNIPLGLALTEFIVQTGIPAIVHHHDFYWERQRFDSPVAMDYLRRAFPPVHPSIHHVVINSQAGAELSRRTGAAWTLIPNVMDFKSLPRKNPEDGQNFRREIGVDPDSLLVLQPTRIVSRKGIETAIELVGRLDIPGSVLVIPHEAGDEGTLYQDRIEDYARFVGVDLRLISDRVADGHPDSADGKKRYALWDIYPHADLVTYPSLVEGYGNAFVEAIYFRKPILVNRYPVFEKDIEPKGFDVITVDGFITPKTIADVRTLINAPERLTRMAETNYMLGWRYLSYEMLAEKLESILVALFGADASGNGNDGR
jgi:mannosylglucosylglycerate synthase